MAKMNLNNLQLTENIKWQGNQLYKARQSLKYSTLCNFTSMENNL